MLNRKFLFGTQPLSTIDYPGKVSYVIFIGGCNFKCGYCHNPEVVKMVGYGQTFADVFADLRPRTKLLEGIVISGGEPTAQPEELTILIQQLKEFGLPIKLDTNGYNPAVLETLLSQKLLDYIAMDIKTSFSKYSQVTGVPVDIEKIKRSIQLIMNSGIPYEFRTTVVPKLVTTLDISAILQEINGAASYYLQQFSPAQCLNPSYQTTLPYSAEELRRMGGLAGLYVNKVEIRNL